MKIIFEKDMDPKLIDQWNYAIRKSCDTAMHDACAEFCKRADKSRKEQEEAEAELQESSKNG